MREEGWRRWKWKESLEEQWTHLLNVAARWDGRGKQGDRSDFYIAKTKDYILSSADISFARS